MLIFVTRAYSFSTAAVGDDVTSLQVLVESEQMRREADDIGPRVELEHWKKRMAQFNFLLEQIKQPAVGAVVGVLNVAKSKLLAVSQYAGKGKGKVKVNVYLYSASS